MGSRYKLLRQQLDELGYKQILVPEAIPLVEKLVADLIQTTNSLEKYMKIAKAVSEERDNLELGAEPYKCDNAKLVRECNELHQAFLQYKEKSEAIQKDLQKEIKDLQHQISHCEKQKENLKQKVRDLEYSSVIAKSKRSGIASRSTVSLKDKKDLKSSSTTKSLEGAMSAANQKVAQLTNEIKKLKDEKLELLDKCECYKKQVVRRDREIERLSGLLEGGRSIQAINSNCCYRNSEEKVCKLQDEVNILKKEKYNLESCLKDAVAKQHEAMKRALHLAERNRELERELRDIDQMALAVEADANYSAKTYASKVCKLQDKIHDALSQIQGLEKEVNQLRREKQEILSDWETTKIEKKHLQSLLETALEEKRLMTDRINQFTVIEDDLNIEIDRLMQLTAEQKQKIAELECQLMSKNLDSNIKKQPSVGTEKQQKGATRTKSPTKSNKSKSSPSKKSLKKKKKKKQKSKDEQFPVEQNPPVDTNKTTMDEMQKDKSVGTQDYCRCCNSSNCVERMRNYLDRDLEQRQLQMCLISLDNMRGEKEHYMKEYHRLLDQLNSRTGQKNTDMDVVKRLNDREKSLDNIQQELNQKINEKDQIIMNLQRENKTLAEEKFNLLSRLETARDRTDTDLEAMSLKSTVKRLEREKELLKASVDEIEEERNKLKKQIREITESRSLENARIERQAKEIQHQLETLQREKRELIQDQDAKKTALFNIQVEIDSLRVQLEASQTELAHQKNLYNQLKNLQEQSDRAVLDSQNKIRQLEAQLADTKNRLEAAQSSRDEQGQLIINLKHDINSLKRNLTQLEEEKDEILNSLDLKTENIAKLEKEIKQKNGYIAELEANVTDLKQQISVMADSASTNEHKLRNMTAENLNLKKELEATLKVKENALIENRRVQEELAACIAEGKNVHKDLEIAKRQIEDLKQQLQHYVAEVKRTEDLITQKEIERNELLDQFRNLHDEAAVLENSNHSLASAATQSRVQLSVALEHATELEKRLQDQTAVIQAHEKQIAELTSEIARLEVELKRQDSKKAKLETEIASMKDLCAKLDQQKDNTSRQLSDKVQLMSEVEKLRRDSESLRESLMKDRNNIENLERLLFESRQEAVNSKLINQDLQDEIQRLRSKAEDLQNKLIKCMSESNRHSVNNNDGSPTPSKKNEEGRTSTAASTVVEVELAESVTVKDNNKKGVVCCCCPSNFSGTGHRTHVCYCPMYDMTRVLLSSPRQSNGKQEDCGCGTKLKCCVQPFINHSVTYSLHPKDCACPPANNVRE